MPNFAAGGIATPADAALCMALGAEAVFVGSGIFLAQDPARRAAAIVDATTYYRDQHKLAAISADLGEADAGDRDRGLARRTALRRARDLAGENTMDRSIGVLALQGNFAAHAAALSAAGLRARPVRQAQDLLGLAGLVLPGGESTTQWKLLHRHDLAGALATFIASGAPVLATCAGLILVARAVEHPVQASFGWLDVVVARNAWGRQLDSFEAVADDDDTELIFIRAPRILDWGPAVKVLARWRGEPVLVRQGNLTGATFHPELARGSALHRAIFA